MKKKNGFALTQLVVFMTLLMVFTSLPALNQLHELNALGVNDSTVVNVGVQVIEGEVVITPMISDSLCHSGASTRPLRRNNP